MSEPTLDDFTRTLQSIAAMRCCHCCVEAAGIAQAALQRVGTVVRDAERGSDALRGARALPKNALTDNRDLGEDSE